MPVTQKCQNCHVRQTMPEYLWREVRYKDVGTKTVCPACYEWAKRHPEALTAPRTPGAGKEMDMTTYKLECHGVEAVEPCGCRFWRPWAHWDRPRGEGCDRFMTICTCCADGQVGMPFDGILTEICLDHAAQEREHWA